MGNVNASRKMVLDREQQRVRASQNNNTANNASKNTNSMNNNTTDGHMDVSSAFSHASTIKSSTNELATDILECEKVKLSLMNILYIIGL